MREQDEKIRGTIIAQEILNRAKDKKISQRCRIQLSLISPCCLHLLPGKAIKYLWYGREWKLKTTAYRQLSVAAFILKATTSVKQETFDFWMK